MVDRGGLVMVVVVDVQAWVARAALGDEVDQLLERALLARPITGPDLVYRGSPASSASAVSTTPNRYCSPNSRPSSE
jgi:hypothetical protein